MSTHIGFDFTPPDVPGKVTGEIKYAEDYKREGMVFCSVINQPATQRQSRWHRRQRSTADGWRSRHIHRRRPPTGSATRQPLLWHRNMSALSANLFLQSRPSPRRSLNRPSRKYASISNAARSWLTPSRASRLGALMLTQRAIRWYERRKKAGRYAYTRRRNSRRKMATIGNRCA